MFLAKKHAAHCIDSQNMSHLTVNTSKLPETTLPKDCRWHCACLWPQTACNAQKPDRTWCCSWAISACLALQSELSWMRSVSARQFPSYSSPITIHITHPQNVLMDFGPLHSEKAPICQQLLRPDKLLLCDWQWQTICLSKDLCPNLNHSKCGAKPYGNSPANCLQHTWVLACIT